MKKSKVYLAGIVLSVAFCCFSIKAQDGKRDAAPKAQDVPVKVSLASNEVFAGMQTSGRKSLVEAKINGKGPYKFFLDTGAAATVLNQDLVDELKLPVKGSTKIGDPASPEAITAQQNWVERLDIGEATFSGFIALSWDRSMLDKSDALHKSDAPRGVLGMPLFRQLLLTFDYPQSRIIIRRGELPIANGADVLEYQFSESGLFGVPLIVAGTNLFATLDTGSMGGLSFPNSYMSRLPLNGKPVEIGRGRTVAGESVIYGASLNGIVKLGNYRFENPAVQFFDRLTHLNLGYGFISQFAITIDQKNHRLKFEKAASRVDPATQTQTKNDKPDEYAGMYGERRVTAENGRLYLQRLSGPLGEGPKIQLTQITRDEFALEGTNIVRVRFIRNQAKEISEIQVLNPNGEWENARKDK